MCPSKLLAVRRRPCCLPFQVGPHCGSFSERSSLLLALLPLSSRASRRGLYAPVPSVLSAQSRLPSPPAVLRRAPVLVASKVSRVPLAGQRLSSSGGATSSLSPAAAVPSVPPARTRLSFSSQPPLPNPALNRTACRRCRQVPSAFGSGGRLALRWGLPRS